MNTKTNQPRTRYSICVILLLSMLLSGCEFLKDGDSSNNDSPLGIWEITEITGYIKDVREVGNPVLCEAYENTYYPWVDADLSYIGFEERQKDPDLESIPDGLFHAFSPSDTGGVFVFYITFDNGYYSNDILGDFGVQLFYETIFTNAYSFYGGRWTEEGVIGFSEAGTAGGGYSLFTVEGVFVSDNRIEGNWELTENTAWPEIGAPECDSYASGSGTWLAVKK